MDTDLFISIDSEKGLIYAGFAPIETDEQKKKLVGYIKNSGCSNTIELMKTATIPFQNILDKMQKDRMVYIEAVKHLWVANAYSLENKVFVEKGAVHILTEFDQRKFEEICKNYSKP